MRIADITITAILCISSSNGAVIWLDDFIDDGDGLLPVINTTDTDGGGADVADVGVSWIDLGADNMAVADTNQLSLRGAAGGGMDSGIRGTFSTVNSNHRFVVSMDVSFGSGQAGTHLAIGNSLSEDVGANLITSAGFFGVRLIKGGDIENWNGTGWESVGTVADFSGQTVTITMDESDYDISVGTSNFTNIGYGGARTDFSQMELAFAGNNGSRSITGLISGDNLGVIPEPSHAMMFGLSGIALLLRRRRSKPAK